MRVILTVAFVVHAKINMFIGKALVMSLSMDSLYPGHKLLYIARKMIFETFICSML